jgi:putative transposase
LRWTLIKRWFSTAIPADESRSASRAAKGERGIWQRRFWEHTVRDPDDFARHVDYVHFNPVKHGLVARAVDWPHSSFRRAVARGDYPADWAQADNDVGRFGEVEGGPK